MNNSVSVPFPGLGHETINSAQCATTVALSFLDDPDGRPDTSCVAEMQAGFITEPIAARLTALQNKPPILRLGLLIGSRESPGPAPQPLLEALQRVQVTQGDGGRPGDYQQGFELTLRAERGPGSNLLRSSRRR